MKKIIFFISITLVLITVLYLGFKFYQKKELSRELKKNSSILNPKISIWDIQRLKITGQNSGPYKPGDTVLCEKTSFKYRGAKMGDIIQYKKGSLIILGEIVGVPGQTNSKNVEDDGVPADTYVTKNDSVFDYTTKENILCRVFKKLY